VPLEAVGPAGIIWRAPGRRWPQFAIGAPFDGGEATVGQGTFGNRIFSPKLQRLLAELNCAGNAPFCAGGAPTATTLAKISRAPAARPAYECPVRFDVREENMHSCGFFRLQVPCSLATRAPARLVCGASAWPRRRCSAWMSR
jgi:hypothetical protein